MLFNRGWAQKYWVLKRKNELKIEKSSYKENGEKNVETCQQTLVLSGLRLAKELVELLHCLLSAPDQPSLGHTPAVATSGNDTGLPKLLTLH